MSDNYPEQIQHIQNNEKVNASTIGRVTRALAARTDNFRLFQLEQLARREILRCDAVPCSSSVSNYTFGYLNPSNGLIETADLDIANPSFPQNLPIGVILNKRTSLLGFVCDIVVKGKLSIPAANLSTIISDVTWAKGMVYYLDENGQMTFDPPALEIPVGISLAPTPQGQYHFLVDIAKNTELKHSHVREELTWDTNGNYVLQFEPTNPEAVFLTIDDIIQTLDTEGVGNWVAPQDPDYIVAGKSLTVYTPIRYEGNPEDPKIVVWYLTLVGSTEKVTGIIAGKGIALSGCSITDGVGTGQVTITSKPVFDVVSDNSVQAVKNLQFNPATQNIDMFKGPVVTKIAAGQGIFISGTEVVGVEGHGKITINANPSINSTDLLAPESIWLENAKNDLLFNRYDAAILEPSKVQSIILKFTIPQGLESSYSARLILDYIIPSGIPTGDLSLNIDYFQLKPGINLASASGLTLIDSFSLSSGNSSKLLRKEIVLSSLQLVADSILSIEISRHSTDAYLGNFNLVNARLRYRSALI